MSRLEISPAERGGHRLVEQVEPGRRRTAPDPDETELGERAELEIDISDRPGHVERPGREPLGLLEVGHPVRPRHPDPSLQRAGLDRGEQALGAPDPAVGGGEVGEVGLVGDRHLHRALHRARTSPRRRNNVYARAPWVRLAAGSPNHHSAEHIPSAASAVVRSASEAANASWASRHRPPSSAALPAASVLSDIDAILTWPSDG